jgi:hypothetical protein
MSPFLTRLRVELLPQILNTSQRSETCPTTRSQGAMATLTRLKVTLWYSHLFQPQPQNMSKLLKPR